jgi:hypothetical protein
MPKYLVEMHDGRKFQVEADSQPSEADVLAKLGETAKPAVNVVSPDEPGTYIGGFAKSMRDTIAKTGKGVLEGLNPLAAAAAIWEGRNDAVLPFKPEETDAEALARIKAYDATKAGPPLSDPETGGRAIGGLLLTGLAGRAPDIPRPTGPQLVKGAITAGKMVKSPIRTTVGMLADELDRRSAQPVQAAPTVRPPTTAPAAPPTPVAAVPEPAPVVPDSALSTVELARKEAAAGRLHPKMLEAIEKFEAAKAARSASAVPAGPAATVSAPAEPIAPPASASPAATPPQVAAPAAPAMKLSDRLNLFMRTARQAGVTLSPDDYLALNKAVTAGADPQAAIGALIAERNPAAAFAAKYGLPQPSGNDLRFPKGMRGNATGAQQ